MKKYQQYDTVIIGGGFYGLRIAQFLKEDLGQNRILVIEKENEVMQRASYNNQARVHGGYHYPRSVLTALRSRVNLPIFSEEYKEAIVDDFVKYYGVASNLSKVSARQFSRFYERIGAKTKKSEKGRELFDIKLIDDVFEVEEYAFNTSVLKSIVLDKVISLGIEVHTNEKVQKIKDHNNKIVVSTSSSEYTAESVINTTYSSINNVNKNSNLPIIPFKHELTEMCLIEIPEELKHGAYTIMCGPFFSIMPFPDKKMYTLSHVRYTPHSEWYDTDENIRDSHQYLNKIERVTHFPQMIADVKRYMPHAAKIKYSGESLWEIKTVLPQSEGDDSRPILYKVHYGGIHNYICIMGGKIDNIYDVFKELRITYAKKS
jgi:glycine/D-amino acid oxidase-like deaminating enzyme